MQKLFAKKDGFRFGLTGFDFLYIERCIYILYKGEICERKFWK